MDSSVDARLREKQESIMRMMNSVGDNKTTGGSSTRSAAPPSITEDKKERKVPNAIEKVDQPSKNLTSQKIKSPTITSPRKSTMPIPLLTARSATVKRDEDGSQSPSRPQDAEDEDAKKLKFVRRTTRKENDQISPSSSSTTLAGPNRSGSLSSMHSPLSQQQHRFSILNNSSQRLPSHAHAARKASISTHTKSVTTATASITEDGNNGEESDDDFEDFAEASDLPGDVPIDDSPLPPPPILKYSELENWRENNDIVKDTVSSLLAFIYPPYQTTLLPSPQPLQEAPSSQEPYLHSARSVGLWKRLSSPKLKENPIVWKRSHIRRLFFMSQGIPVDLDEVLPPTEKQRRMVLTSVNLTKVNEAEESKPHRTENTDEDIGPPPEFDFDGARNLCSMSELSLSHLPTPALQQHIHYLEESIQAASECLAHWLQIKDSLISDKEAFEQVIESLVGYAQRLRKGHAKIASAPTLPGRSNRNTMISLRKEDIT